MPFIPDLEEAFDEPNLPTWLMKPIVAGFFFLFLLTTFIYKRC